MMLLEIATTMILSLGGASLALPATKNLLLGDVKRSWLNDELEFDRILDDGVTVRFKSGHLFRAFSLKGVPYETKPLEQQEQLMKGRLGAFHEIGQAGANFRIMGIKRQEDVSFDAVWPSVTLKEIGDIEQETFKNAYDIRWLLIIDAKVFSKLDKACEKAQMILGDYEIAQVRTPEDKTQFCPLTSLLGYLVTGELRHDIKPVSRSISANIQSCPFGFTVDGLIETQTPLKKVSKVISISKWQDVVSGFLVTELMAIAGDIEICHIARPYNSEQIATALKRKSNEFTSSFFGNTDAAIQHTAVAELVASGGATLFATQFQVIVRANNETELDALIVQVAEIISRREASYSIETDNAPICWFNRMPTLSKLVHPEKMLNDNIAAIWAFQYSAKGMRASPMGPLPIRLFKTLSGQSYSFQFHASNKPQSPGNYIIFAATGGGKSTLVMHLLGGLAKFSDVRNYIFDSKEGARAMIEGFGGKYQSFETLALNPLDVATDDVSSEHQISMVMKAMIGAEITDEMEPQIDHTIKSAFAIQPPHRTFSGLFDTSLKKGSKMHKLFSKWVTDKNGKKGLYSHVFNAPKDTLSTYLKESFLIGINMNEALEDPVLGAPVVAHIANAIEQSAKAHKGKFTIFVDEAANLLQNTGFRDVVLKMYREYRKMNGLVGLAFQDPAALVKFADHQGIINNTQTLIFFPNSMIKKDDLDPYNLNEEQVNFITGGGHQGGGRLILIVKRDASTGYNESTILDIDLEFLKKAIRHYRAGVDANRVIDEAKEKYGEDWLCHV